MMISTSTPTSYSVDEAAKVLRLTFMDAPGPGHPDPASFYPSQEVVVEIDLKSVVIRPLYPVTEV